MRYKLKILSIILLILVISLTGLVSGASKESFTNALYAGQHKLYTIDVPCLATVVLDGHRGAEFSLYAKRTGSGWIPSANHVIRFPDVSTPSPGTNQKLYLDAGEWLVVAESRKGFGEFTLTVSKDCPITTTCMGGPCFSPADYVPATVLINNVQSGFLNTGESKMYVYRLSGDRSYVEWVLSGPCDKTAPMMKTQADVELFRTSTCAPDFNLYVYQSCNPKYYPCKAIAADISPGSNAYVGISGPESDKLYYVKVYGNRGRGDYQLTARTYKGSEMTIAGIKPSEFSGFIATETNVTAPDDLTAEIPVPPTAYTVWVEDL